MGLLWMQELASCKILASLGLGLCRPELIQWQELLSTRVRFLGLPQVRSLLSLLSSGGASLAEICDPLSQQPALLPQISYGPQG